jgi:transcriptional regulator GlxA family with amidase domain
MKKPTGKFRRPIRKPKIGALVHEFALASSVTLPTELAMAAAQASGQSTGTDDLLVTLFSPNGGSIKTSGGLEVMTQPIAEAASLDLLVIAAIWRDPRRVIKRYPELIPFIAKLVNQGSSIAAVGTGSFLLAETGLLDKKPATTHWFWLDEFASRYPAVDLRRDELIVQSDSLYCAGSVNSISDLLVYLMGNFYNNHIARHVENQFSPEIRRRFKSTQLGSQVIREHRDEVVLDVQMYMQEKFTQSLSMVSIAAMFDLSERTLTRRFQRAAGTTPWQYLLNLRLSEAESLLRTTNLSITEIAAEVGMVDLAHFSRQFKKANRLSPSEYRKAVRGKVFSPI